MSRFVFCAALVNSQIWAASLILAPKPLTALFCAACWAVWIAIAFVTKEPTNDR